MAEGHADKQGELKLTIVAGCGGWACLRELVEVRVTGVRSCLLLVWLVLGCLPALAREGKFPERPPSRILDEGEVFAREPERMDVLSKRLRDLSDRTGYEVYVLIFNTLIGSELRDEGVLAKEAWIGEKPGVVLVLENDSGHYVLEWVRSEDVLTENGNQLPVLGEHDLAPQEQIRIRSELQSLPEIDGGPVAKAEILVGRLADAIGDSFQAANPKDSGRAMRTMLLAVGAISSMLLVALLISVWMSRRDRKVKESFRFPEVEVGTRLGASCGGGKVSSRNFGSSLQNGKV